MPPCAVVKHSAPDCHTSWMQAETREDEFNERFVASTALPSVAGFR